MVFYTPSLHRNLPHVTLFNLFTRSLSISLPLKFNYRMWLGFWALAGYPATAIRLGVCRRQELKIMLSGVPTQLSEERRGWGRSSSHSPVHPSEHRSLNLTLPSQLTVSSFSPPICPVCRRWGPRQRSTSMPHLGERTGHLVVSKFLSF